MNDAGTAVVLPVFLLLCRIGACLMLMPGISSPRVPVQVRLFLTIGTTFAVAPLLLANARGAIGDGTDYDKTFLLIVSESLIGAMIGFMGRVFFLALETFATATTMAIGLANLLAPAMDSDETLPELTTFVTLGATTIFFLTDLPYEVLKGLVLSYDAVPIAGWFQPQHALVDLTDVFARAFVLALRVSNPFIIFAVIINLAIGLLNKLTPQIPVYFISAPFVVAMGLFLLYFSGQQMLMAFIDGFAAWLTRG